MNMMTILLHFYLSSKFPEENVIKLASRVSRIARMFLIKTLAKTKRKMPLS